MRAAVFCLFAAGLLPAQIHLPTRGRKPAAAKEVLQQFTGHIQSVEPESLTLNAEDTRVVTFKCTKDTKYLQDEKPIQRTVLKAGDEVEIEARGDNEGFFQAVNVTLVKAAAPQKAQAPAPAPAAAPSAEAPPPREPLTEVNAHPPEADPNRPILHRGKPVHRAEKTEEPEEAPAQAPAEAKAAPPPPPTEPETPHPDDAFLEKARETAMEFTETLPNYICSQMTTRYQGQGRPVDWTPLDVVTAAVVYADGKESYKDIKVNGKATNKPMEKTQGSWSRGEFGSTLRDLFSPATAAEFHQRNESVASGRPAVRYDFSVKQPNSHWLTQLGGQSVTPAYRGSVWIDKKTYRVLRIEMQAREVPDEFPLDQIEWAVDYAFVRIGGMNEFLVPVHGDNLSCWRGSTQCARNALDFRNYRRFTAESTISTTDSTVTYDPK